MIGNIIFEEQKIIERKRRVRAEIEAAEARQKAERDEEMDDAWRRMHAQEAHERLNAEGSTAQRTKRLTKTS